MTMAYSWDETSPADGDLISSGDDAIREFKKAIRERLDVEHVFTTGNEAAVGEHAPGFITEGKGYIAAAAVTHANLKTPAHGNGVFTADSLALPLDDTTTVIQTKSIVSTGGNIIINLGCFLSITTNAPPYYGYVRLYRDSTLLATFSGIELGYLSAQYYDAPGAGTYTYTMKWYNTSIQISGTATNRSLSLVEVYT